jgi:hypothetical protein
MNSTKTPKQQPVSEPALPILLPKEIQEALELMRRVKTARAGQENPNAQETPGNKYILPEAPVLRVSGSTEHN